MICDPKYNRSAGLGVGRYCLLPKYCTLLLRDLKSTSCAWCLPSTWVLEHVRGNMEKITYLKTSTLKNTWPRHCSQLISSPQIVFDANILSNITYQISKDFLCVFDFSSSLSVFVRSPGGQFYQDAGEISDLSQSGALNIVMWRVSVMQPTTPSNWRRGRCWQFNVQENGSMKYH